MKLALHATRRTSHNASRVVHTMSAGSVKTGRAPSRHCRVTRVYGHTATTMLEMNTPPPPLPPFLLICMCTVPLLMYYVERNLTLPNRRMSLPPNQNQNQPQGQAETEAGSAEASTAGGEEVAPSSTAAAALLQQEFGVERDALSARLVESEAARSTAEEEAVALRERWVGGMVAGGWEGGGEAGGGGRGRVFNLCMAVVV